MGYPHIIQVMDDHDFVGFTLGEDWGSPSFQEFHGTAQELTKNPLAAAGEWLGSCDLFMNLGSTPKLWGYYDSYSQQNIEAVVDDHAANPKP